jgi:hypothetical protein
VRQLCSAAIHRAGYFQDSNRARGIASAFTHWPHREEYGRQLSIMLAVVYAGHIGTFGCWSRNELSSNISLYE